MIDVDPLADDKDRLRGLTLTAEFKSSAGDLLGRYSGDLADDWTWTVPYYGPSGASSYLYGRGFSLVPSGDESYELGLALTGKASDPTVESKVVLTGGGWK